MSTPADPAPRDPDESVAGLDQPRPAPPAQEPGPETGATASERAAAQTAAELSGR